MKSIQLLILITLISGCASVTPKELIDARSAYQQASNSPSAKLVPAELHKANMALASAEQSFKDDPESYKTRDLSYVAQRKSQLAKVVGIMAADQARQANSNSQYGKIQSAVAAQAKQNLSDSRAQAITDKANRDLRESEARTAAALAELAQLAAVREEERGLVITLSGNVLFRSSESKLLDSAKIKLDQVSVALSSVGQRSLIVEGHTDSQGSESYNQGLSQQRANAVREYLVQKGFPSDRIRALGMGQGSPIADNKSPEGRANNRRVEIVIERELRTSNQ